MAGAKVEEAYVLMASAVVAVTFVAVGRYEAGFLTLLTHTPN